MRGAPCIGAPEASDRLLVVNAGRNVERESCAVLLKPIEGPIGALRGSAIGTYAPTRGRATM